MKISKKTRTAFFCTKCGAQHTRWQGQCKECTQWNTLVEEKIASSSSKPLHGVNKTEPVPLPQINYDNQSGWISGISEFDRVVGGRLLPGMTMLLGGEPGIGKSTLILQLAEAYSGQGMSVCYVTGEEALSQIKHRAERLKINGKSIDVLTSNSLDETVNVIGNGTYQIVLIDSIQTISSEQFDSPPGSVAQVREVAHQLVMLARQKQFALCLVGHVTKDGMVAGPKVLEHIVDTVVYFEGDSTHLYRMLRATKNRFGAISEIGLFEMLPEGLVSVADPSSMFLSDHSDQSRTGSVVTAICEGRRPILVEIQALVTPAAYGSPQRVGGGIDNKRLALLLAILEKREEYPMSTHDVFVSIAGGLRLAEPSLDLPILTAIASSLLNRSVDSKAIAVGEVGLSGEVRGVSMIDRRLSEAERMGFKTAVIPGSNKSQGDQSELVVVASASLSDALEHLLQ